MLFSQDTLPSFSVGMPMPSRNTVNAPSTAKSLPERKGSGRFSAATGKASFHAHRNSLTDAVVAIEPKPVATKEIKR